MSDQQYHTLGVVARRYGCAVWQIRRLFERGLLPPAPRIGAYRVIPAHDLPKVEAALREAGYIGGEPQKGGARMTPLAIHNVDDSQSVKPAPSSLIQPALLLRARDAAALSAVSLATWNRWHAAKKCPAPVRVGVTVRWRADELRSWVEAGCPCRKVWDAMKNANGQPRRIGR